MASILLFDDNLELLEMFQFLFTMYKYEVRTVNSRSLFMAKLRENKPDLILLDIMLKDANGVEMCKELKSAKETMSIPILLISANAQKFPGHGDCNADDFLEKPFTLPVLINKIQALLQTAAIA